MTQPPQHFEQLARQALALGLQQVEAAGTPIHPFIVEPSGAMYLVELDGQTDPVVLGAVALGQLQHRPACIAFVFDTRMQLDGDSKKRDALVVTVCERDGGEGYCWAQRYQAGGLLRRFAPLGNIEPIGTSQNMFEMLDDTSAKRADADAPGLVPQAADLDELQQAINSMPKNAGEQMHQQALQVAIDRMRDGVSPAQAMADIVSGNPDDLLAVSLAKSIADLAFEPPWDGREADLADFPAYQRKFVTGATLTLAGMGFTPLGYFEPVHLRPQLGQRVVMGVSTSNEGALIATAYAVRPLWPGWLGFLRLKLAGLWQTLRTVELETVYEDDSVLVTVNTGDVSPFRYRGGIDIVTLPPATQPADLIDAHRARVDAFATAYPGVKPVRIRGPEDFGQLQERVRRAKSAYRQAIGFVHEDELRQLLGERYDDLAGAVRSRLVEITSGASESR